MISSQPHLGDHYICLCMLNILWNYTRQVSKSRLSLYLPLALPFSTGSPFILSPQRDRETITITGHSSLAQDYFPGKKRSAEYRWFCMRFFYAHRKNLRITRAKLYCEHFCMSKKYLSPLRMC